jgi:hypothetical protein
MVVNNNVLPLWVSCTSIILQYPFCLLFSLSYTFRARRLSTKLHSTYGIEYTDASPQDMQPRDLELCRHILPCPQFYANISSSVLVLCFPDRQIPRPESFLHVNSRAPQNSSPSCSFNQNTLPLIHGFRFCTTTVL